MLIPLYTGSFKKDRRLMIKRGKDINELTEVMKLLINEQPLLAKHRNHSLQGSYNGKWECHIEPDWLLVYRIDKGTREIVFYRTGTHSDLF
ncbi:MAG: type II toxin-antitoxin system YafQ family toxin [Treponema sp.]|nr:type II toxin-antitoxin system YafQ family toxin [Treponema sp.]